MTLSSYNCFIGILDRFTIQNHYGDTLTNIVHLFRNDEYELKPKHSKARKMWHLAYTLVSNPDLAELRRRDKATASTDDLAAPITSSSVFGIVEELIEKDEVKENFDGI